MLTNGTTRTSPQAGIAFVGCNMMAAAAPQDHSHGHSDGHAHPRRREVVVNGKRVKTVDIHAHCHIPEALALLGQQVRFPGLVIGPDRIKVMDEQGIDIEALSVNPNFWDKAERDQQAQVVKVQNEKTFLALPGRTPLLAIFWGVALGG